MKLPACPVETTLMLIGDKWKVLILRELMGGTQRFGQLKKSIGSVSQKVLTAQLRDMEATGLLTRKVYAQVPPNTLTDTGYSLKPILDAMVDWGTGYQQKNARQDGPRRAGRTGGAGVTPAPLCDFLIYLAIFTTALTMLALSATLRSMAFWMSSKSKMSVTMPFKFTLPEATASMAMG